MSCYYYASTRITGSPDDIRRLADVVEQNIQETRPDMLDVSLEGIAGCRLNSYCVARGSWVYDPHAKPGEANLWLTTNYGWPQAFLWQLSLRFPDLLFQTGVNDEGYGFFSCEFRNGWERFCEPWEQYFIQTEPGSSPVHHSVIELDIDADASTKRALDDYLRAEGVYIPIRPGQTRRLVYLRNDGKPVEAVSRHNPEEVIARINSRFSNVLVKDAGSAAYTLNEMDYQLLFPADALEGFGSSCLASPPEWFEPFLSVLERDLDLTDDERGVIGRRHRSEVPHSPVVRAWRLEKLECASFRPNGPELEWLLADYESRDDSSDTKQRQSQIRQALATPKWMTSWPAWEIEIPEPPEKPLVPVDRATETEQQAPATNAAAPEGKEGVEPRVDVECVGKMTDKDFLQELRDMSTPMPKHPAKLSCANAGKKPLRQTEDNRGSE